MWRFLCSAYPFWVFPGRMYVCTITKIISSLQKPYNWYREKMAVGTESSRNENVGISGKDGVGHPSTIYFDFNFLDRMLLLAPDGFYRLPERGRAVRRNAQLHQINAWMALKPGWMQTASNRSNCRCMKKVYVNKEWLF